MSFFSLQGDRPATEPSLNDNNAHKHGDLDVSDEMEGAASLADEQKRMTQTAIMMQDLGSSVRDRITRSDVTRAPNVSVRELQKGRAVEDPGSEANRAYAENKQKINGWNNLYVELKNDGGAEELDRMMDGQSHRAKLRDVIVTGGGQPYHTHSSDDPSPHTLGVHSSRGAPAIRACRGGVVAGTDGRRVAASHRRPTILSNDANYPLDPAIDRNDPRSKYSRAHETGQSSKSSRQANRPPKRDAGLYATGIGPGRMRQDLGTTKKGTTVYARTTPKRRPHPRQLSPDRKWASASLAVNRRPEIAPATTKFPVAKAVPVLQDAENGLDPSRFLAVLGLTEDRETFNKMVSFEPKPAPTPRAAVTVAKPPKQGTGTSHQLVDSTTTRPISCKPTKRISSLDLFEQYARRLALMPATRNSPLDKSIANQVALNKQCINIPTPDQQKPEKLNVMVPNFTNIIQEKYEKQPVEENKVMIQVPTREFVFPPPSSTSTNLSADGDAHTDGVTTSGTSNFSAVVEDSAAVETANEVQGSTSGDATQPTSVPLECTRPLYGIGGSVKPTHLPPPNQNAEADLLMLGSEEVASCRIHASSPQTTQVRGAAADLMDLDFSITIQQSPTPSRSEPFQEQKLEREAEPIESAATPVGHPTSLVIDGIRYYREDQLAHVISPRAGFDGDARAIPASADTVTTSRVITASGYPTGVRCLGPQEDNLLGDCNLAESAEELSEPAKIDSIWADPGAAPAGRRRVRKNEPVHVRPKLDPHLDARPSAIGDQNLPGRSQGIASRVALATAPRESLQAEGPNARTSTQCDQVRSMPVAANLWDTVDIVSLAVRPADHRTASQLNESIERMGASPSLYIAEECPHTVILDQSVETTPSSQARESLFNQTKEPKACTTESRSPVSEDSGTLNANPAQSTVEQGTVSKSAPICPIFDNAGCSRVQRHLEAEEQQMVPMMSCPGPLETTPFVQDPQIIESRQNRYSTLFAGNFGPKPPPWGIIGKPTTNLATSKWAAEEVCTLPSTASLSSKSAEVASHLPTAIDSNVQFMRRGGKRRTRITRTNAGPGFAMLMAEAAAVAESSSSASPTAYVPGNNTAAFPATTAAAPMSLISQDMNTNNCATSRASSGQAESGAAPRPGVQPQGIRGTEARGIMMSAPRVRVINQSRSLGQRPLPGTVQRGRGNFRYRSEKQGDSESGESEL